MDPTPFWNMHRNCCYLDDLLVRILSLIKFHK
jgi:hypothetical protein